MGKEAKEKNEAADDNQSNKPNRDRNYRRNPRYTKKPFDQTKDKSQDSILSVVIPLYNEEESLPELALHLESELQKFAKDRFEVVFVDDGSTDKSYSVIKQIHDRNRKFKALRLRRNYGKSAALSVGFEAAKGVIIITMDADMQDDPAEIQNLIAKLKDGYDLVTGWKKRRKDPLNKKIPSKLFNFVTSMLTGLKLHDFNCGLKAYRREVVKSIQVYGEMHRYIPALAKWHGFRIAEIPVVHHPRKYGKTKFGFSRYIKGFLDLLTVLFTTRYLKRPLHFFGTFGTLFVIVGFALDLYLSIEWALGNTFLSNRPLALLGIAMIIVGVQFISMGLLGELLVKNTQSNQQYSIKERIY